MAGEGRTRAGERKNRDVFGRPADGKAFRPAVSCACFPAAEVLIYMMYKRTYALAREGEIMLKTVDFFGTSITRMIIGDNPVTGHSYIEELIPGSDMKEWYTTEKTVEMYFHAEELGFNTMLPLAREDVFTALREYRRLGGKMNLIFQPCMAGTTIERNIEDMMALDPIGLYHQGTNTDYMMETGAKETILKDLELYHATGLPIGLGTHVPETVLTAEREGWDVDFYMACLYNARRDRRGEPSGFLSGKSKKGLVFYPEDRFDMFRVIRSVPKPFIAYKVLAGGQIFLSKTPEEYRDTAKQYIAEAYENVKPGDVLCVGVFQRDKDQLGEEAAIVRELLG